MEKWTIDKMKKAAKEERKGRIIYVTNLEYPDLLKDMDNFMFGIRPDLVLQLSSYDMQGNYSPFSEDYLTEISAMKNVKKISLLLGSFQEFANFNLPALNYFQIGCLPRKITKPIDLSFLKILKDIEFLWIQNGRYTGFEVISNFKKLKTLLLQFITLNSLDFAANTKMDFLSIDDCRLNCDLSVLNQSNIQSLSISENHNLTDLHFIEKMSALKHLEISQSKATGLFDFSNLTHLEKLLLKRMKSLESIACLSFAKSLKTLYIEELNTKIKATDFQILLKFPKLESLYIDYLDFGKKRIQEVKKIFTEAGKSHILKEGLIVSVPENHPAYIERNEK